MIFRHIVNIHTTGCKVFFLGRCVELMCVGICSHKHKSWLARMRLFLAHCGRSNLTWTFRAISGTIYSSQHLSFTWQRLFPASMDFMLKFTAAALNLPVERLQARMTDSWFLEFARVLDLLCSGKLFDVIRTYQFRANKSVKGGRGGSSRVFDPRKLMVLARSDGSKLIWMTWNRDIRYVAWRRQETKCFQSFELQVCRSSWRTADCILCIYTYMITRVASFNAFQTSENTFRVQTPVQVPSPGLSNLNLK